MNTAPSLHSLQREFMSWVLGDSGADVAAAVRGNGLTPAARLGIYRNIVFNNLTATLAIDYPTVKRLVGDEFFDSVAARYIRDVPSRSGNLQHFGARFPEFLASTPEAASLPYLADVARLEWARQESLLTRNATPLDPAQLARVSEDSQVTLSLELHPSVRLVDSAYPVLDIWLFCQNPKDGNLTLDGSSQRVMLWRDCNQIAMRAVDAGLYELLAVMQRDVALAAAHDAAVTANPNFDLNDAVQQLFADGLIVGYDL
jgi:hypothetical protein